MKKFNQKLLLFIAVLFFFKDPNAKAHVLKHQSPSLKVFLSEFHQNTKEVMNQLPFKKGQTSPLKFSSQDIEKNNFILSKDKMRQQHCKLEAGVTVCLHEEAGKAAIEANDHAQNLVDNGAYLISNLSNMDQLSLLKKNLSVKPWSDDYWAIYAGILGKRYADSNNIYSSDWRERKNYVEENSVESFMEKNLTDLLSPSEKYDLLVGDTQGTLTKSMWSEGEGYYDRSGKVESWMGICHGWAPAAFMAPRPTQKISVMAFDQKTVLNFYPSDLKGLTTLLWANAKIRSNFIGSRCNAKDPATDEVSGRIIDQQCFDTNPGTWHQAIVNQIGVNDRSFVMDATYDYEVWNQPVYGYEYKYFNVLTGEEQDSWEKAVIELKDYKEDPFKKYRNSLGTHIVGVEMTVEYIVETSPSQAVTDSPEQDASSFATYRYDLEIDDKGNIIGGEWYSNAHPDFMWVPPIGTKAQTEADLYTKGNWRLDSTTENVYKGIPREWKEVAPFASQSSVPLLKVLEGLVNRSNNQLVP